MRFSSKYKLEVKPQKQGSLQQVLTEIKEKRYEL